MTWSAGRRVWVTIGLMLVVLAAAIGGYLYWQRSAISHEHAASAGAAAEDWFCPMHPEVRSDAPGQCPKCGMDLIQADAPGVAPVDDEPAAPAGGMAAVGDVPRAGLTLDVRRQQLIGVRTATVVRKPLAVTTRAVGQVRYDETRQADVNLKVEAFVRELFVDSTGQHVKAGQPLFTVYSPELLATQHEYLLALRSRDQLAASEIGDARSYADRLLAAARQRLHLWDITDAEIERLERTREPREAVEFRSPASGVVIEKRVVQGQRVMPGESLYRLVDLSVVWVEADLYEREMGLVRDGQAATVTLDAWPGERFTGRVSYVYPYVEEATRTVRVRVTLPNRQGRLRPGMFATVELESRLGPGLVVPRDAVIDAGRAQFVFVALGDGYYEPRRIAVGQTLQDEVRVLEGLEEGDVVASAATFFIDSESQLRAAMQGFETPPPIDAAPGTADPAPEVTIAFRTEPDPPRNGDNTFIVDLHDAAGLPVDGAEVSVRIYMPPMPSMNMPAMSAQALLLSQGGGTYRGQGSISMAGRWETTVVATRDGRTIGRRQFAIVAR